MQDWEAIFEAKIAELDAAAQGAGQGDPAHDLSHFKRVVKTAKSLAQVEGAKMEVVIPAAWLHDFVVIPKNDPRRSQASRLSAEAATEFLRSVGYPEGWLAEIGHAIACHSFSANIKPETLEAKIVQDADRLDGVGAIGVARCFATAGLMKTRAFYEPNDPFCETRKPDDRQFTVDHFYVKLFKTIETLQTEAGRAEGARRAERMRRFLAELGEEISVVP